MESAEDIEWSDEDLIQFLELGFSDYTQSTPFVNTASPHQKYARSKPDQFYRYVQNVVDLGWLRSPTTLQTTVPFRIITGAIVRKKDDAEGDRLVWNA